MVRGDHHHTEPGFEQRIDHRPVGTLDGDLVHAGAAKPGHQAPQSRHSVGNGEPVELSAMGVHHGHGMFATGPVDTRGRRRQRWFLGSIEVVNHGVVLLCCCRSRRAPPTVRDTTAGRSLIGALMAHSPVASRRVLGPLGLAELMQDLTDRADMAMTQREPGMHR
jgi:hypothetical protein